MNLWGDAAIRSDGSDTFDSVENVQTGNRRRHRVRHVRVPIASGPAPGTTASTPWAATTRCGAGAGHDVVVGYGGAETIYGESGNDHLYGNGGGDAISGSSGQDFIQGGDGDDDLWGGDDADTFHFASGRRRASTPFNDFNASQDKLSFGSGYFEGQQRGRLRRLGGALGRQPRAARSSLYADRAGQGLTQIAILDGVSAHTINQKIANGTIFDVETSDVGGDGPGGLAPIAPIAVFDPGWDMLA